MSTDASTDTDAAAGDAEQTVLVDTDGPVVTLTLHRPEALNALTPPMLGRLADAVRGAAAADGVRVIVLTGHGRAFSAGVDLKVIGASGAGGGDVGAELNDRARDAIETLTTVGVPVIAKVNGHCFTGALELALACDLLVVADQARLGDTHAKFGLRPTWGMSQRLIRTVGVQRARELSFTARVVTGVEAAEIGLAAASAPADGLDDLVDTMAAAIAENSPGSIAAYKDLYRVALDGGLADGLAYEAATEYVITDASERVAGFGR